MSEFRTPICEMLGIEAPIFLAGMGGVAYAEVCAAVSEAGGFGTLGMAGAPPEEIREQMRKVRALTDKPFGVDLLAAGAAAEDGLEHGDRRFEGGRRRGRRAKLPHVADRRVAKGDHVDHLDLGRRRLTVARVASVWRLGGCSRSHCSHLSVSSLRTARLSARHLHTRCMQGAL